MRKPIHRLIAVLLLFVFTEKAGLRLWFHDYYHTTASVPLSSDEKSGGNFFVPVSCDCIDDFYIPMHYAETWELTIPRTAYYIPAETPYVSAVFSSTIYSGLLRAPPQSLPA